MSAQTSDLAVGGVEGWELLFAGGERKLERFGPLLVERPAPQAIWTLDAGSETADVVFKRNKDGSGKWITKRRKPLPVRASIGDLTFEIRLTGFGNVGLFPEHACHWEWMKERLGERGDPSVLNLFAYTGGASLVCAQAGARVTHVDAAKSVNAWAELNSRLSKIPDGLIRYIADDVIKFVRREIRRRRRYHGIILDPPSFGRGPKGEVWKIERDFQPLLDACFELLDEDSLFMVVTSHSPGVTPAVMRGLVSGHGGSLQSGEMLLRGQGPDLPAGSYLRWSAG